MVLQTQTRNSKHPVTGAKDGASPSRSGGAELEERKPERDPRPGGSVRLPAPGEPAVDKEGGLLGSREHRGWLGPSTGQARAQPLSVCTQRAPSSGPGAGSGRPRLPEQD